MRKYYLFFSIWLLIAPLQAEIYKWTDSRGNVHFSDKPHPGAEKVELPEAQTFSSPPPPSPTETPSSPNTASQLQAYNITIIQPKDQATIRNNQGYIGVMLQVEPELKAGDQFQLIFNGAVLGQPQTSRIFELRNVNRGSHTLAVQVINTQGNVLNISKTITIYMHRPRVGMVSTHNT